jgi:hypothetical protein
MLKIHFQHLYNCITFGLQHTMKSSWTIGHIEVAILYSLSLSNTYRVLSVSPYMPNTHSAICIKICTCIKTMGTSYIASTCLMVEEEGRRDRVFKILNTKSSFTWFYIYILLSFTRFTAQEDFTYCTFYLSHMLQLETRTVKFVSLSSLIICTHNRHHCTLCDKPLISALSFTHHLTIY